MESPFSFDYFVFPPRAMSAHFPPFLIGRASWDNMMMASMIKQAEVLDMDVIDVSATVLALHHGIIDKEMYNFRERSGSYWGELFISSAEFDIGIATNAPYYTTYRNRTGRDAYREPAFGQDLIGVDVVERDLKYHVGQLGRTLHIIVDEVRKRNGGTQDFSILLFNGNALCYMVACR